MLRTRYRQREQRHARTPAGETRDKAVGGDLRRALPAGKPQLSLPSARRRPRHTEQADALLDSVTGVYFELRDAIRKFT